MTPWFSGLLVLLDPLLALLDRAGRVLGRPVLRRHVTRQTVPEPWIGRGLVIFPSLGVPGDYRTLTVTNESDRVVTIERLVWKKRWRPWWASALEDIPLDTDRPMPCALTPGSDQWKATVAEEVTTRKATTLLMASGRWYRVQWSQVLPKN